MAEDNHDTTIPDDQLFDIDFLLTRIWSLVISGPMLGTYAPLNVHCALSEVAALLEQDSDVIFPDPNEQVSIASFISLGALSIDSRFAIAVPVEGPTELLPNDPSAWITVKSRANMIVQWPPGVIIEYPLTSSKLDNHVVHIFPIDPLDYVKLQSNFMYSWGAPKGKIEDCGIELHSGCTFPLREPTTLDEDEWDNHLSQVIPNVNSELFAAFWDGDDTMLVEIQADLAASGSPLPQYCQYACNASSTQTECSVDHGLNGAKLPLVRLDCNCMMCMYTPRDLESCPFIAIVMSGPHTHPIPLPTKTPCIIREVIDSWLSSMGPDLPDATPHHFSHYPSVVYALKTLLPQVPMPTLMDLHLSLGNHDHIHVFINVKKDEMYPFGTDWKGVINYKENQDNKMPKERHYVCHIEEIPMVAREANQEPYHIIVCMTKEMSTHLASAMFIQSDVAFKHVKNWKEFKIAIWDHELNCVVAARAYLNHETSGAHAALFNLIDNIIEEDTGAPLLWRHLDSMSLTEHKGICLWIADFHEGQAHGFGRYLQTAACHRAAGTHDLIEPEIEISYWPDDKEWQKFIWPAICKANNLIPIDVWLASKNHDNTGKSRTLLGALEVGLVYDLRSEQSRQNRAMVT
ncbi:hypothetical protein BS47DRAFT_1358602 [Hydnum rufescens UP504]|uniref:Uncharacterized protein n=1 Tax=Hydnum rufescens UP504 TaxID=1448309 RepID=A0A9P6DYZ7_9AGAM|nr:hypothetical protein BS47DRAFT_1358602 [Hydnum rufescens UP504]